MKQKALAFGSVVLGAVFLFGNVAFAAKTLITRDVWAIVAGSNNETANIYRLIDPETGNTCYVAFSPMSKIGDGAISCVHK